ncbi:MAG: TetR family transcriptional regulator C-terminal domain-containing protein [Spirochaetota bacterium]
MQQKSDHPQNSKVELIFSNALEILKESGIEGLSMRKLSEKSKMSLSNLQYYFKTRELLLAGLLESFLQTCRESLQENFAKLQGSPEDKLQQLLTISLNDETWEDWYKIFVELWALSKRNQTIKTMLDKYYRDYFDLIVELAKTLPVKDQFNDVSITRATAIIIPLLEGYYITKDAIPFDNAEMADLIAKVLMHTIRGNSFSEK